MDFSIIAGPNRHNIAVAVPAFPDDCTSFQVILIDRDQGKYKELVYWNYEEWSQDKDLSCIGAIAGAIKQVNDGADFAEQQSQRADLEWEDL